MPRWAAPQLLIFELFILIVFLTDFALREWIAQKKLSDAIFLLVDFLAIAPSFVVFLHYSGAMQGADVEFLALLRLFGLARILKLLRIQNAPVSIFGASVLTLVFGVMTFHLGLRVFCWNSRVLSIWILWRFLTKRR